MAEDKELSELRKYTTDLKTIKSEVFQLLTQRNIKSASSLFPFLDLAFFQNRKQDIELLDLNNKKDDINLLWDVIRRIDRELEEL
jgi:hypothetical protein